MVKGLLLLKQNQVATNQTSKGSGNSAPTQSVRIPVLKGQTTLEFVLILPLLLFLMLILIQFGVLFYAQTVVTSAAQEGARVAASADKNLKDGLIVARRLADSLGNQNQVIVDGALEGQTVYVRVKATIPVFIPFLDRLIHFEPGATANIAKEGWRN